MVLDKWGGWHIPCPDTTDMQEIDREVLANHPFLVYWDSANECV